MGPFTLWAVPMRRLGPAGREPLCLHHLNRKCHRPKCVIRQQHLRITAVGFRWQMACSGMQAVLSPSGMQAALSPGLELSRAWLASHVLHSGWKPLARC